MPERDPADFRPRSPSSSPRIVAGAVLVAVAAAAAWWLWWRPAQAPAAPAAPASAAAQPGAAAEAPPAPEAPPEGPVHRIDAPADAPALPALADSDAHVAKALGELLGAQKLASFVQLDGFVRRAVATVDNLPRQQAPSRLWPVHPMPERFAVTPAAEGQAQTIAPANAARYTAFVAWAESVPLEAGVALYTRLYPLFQAAYEDLGYPRRYFNDRLVAVIDHLRATPEPEGPLQVQLTQVQGEVPSIRPWVRYEFADPDLQALSSGQKMLLRMGPDNARRLKAVLAELRRRLATAELAQRPAG